MPRVRVNSALVTMAVIVAPVVILTQLPHKAPELIYVVCSASVNGRFHCQLPAHPLVSVSSGLSPAVSICQIFGGVIGCLRALQCNFILRFLTST